MTNSTEHQPNTRAGIYREREDGTHGPLAEDLRMLGTRYDQGDINAPVEIAMEFDTIVRYWTWWKEGVVTLPFLDNEFFDAVEVMRELIQKEAASTKYEQYFGTPPDVSLLPSVGEIAALSVSLEEARD